MTKSISDLASSNKPAGKEHLPPDGTRLAEGLIKQGYSFNQAVADVIDNAIDEDAKNILIRFMLRPSGGYDLLISDDGTGMTEEELKEGMRVGTPSRKGSSKLGKFGLGLKQASLSRCHRLIVASRSKEEKIPAARAWDKEGFRISMGEVWDRNGAAKFLEESFCGLDMSKCGTVVYWQQADRSCAPETVQEERRRLKTYLGVHFHHFLSSGTKIFVDTQTIGESSTGLPYEKIEPISPFGYENSGDPDFPVTFEVKFKGYPAVRLKAHIFPHKKDQSRADKEPYRLYLGANNASGFYIYRNKRLIVAGDWLGKQKHEAHTSLARIEMTLPPELDEFVLLNVQKFSTQFPTEFIEEIWKAKSGEVSFADYMKAADKVYRHRTGKQNLKDYPLVPDSGFPKQLGETYGNLIGATAGKSRVVKFEWVNTLPDEIFYSLDRDAKSILLNRKYRAHFNNGSTSPVDAPLVKLLLLRITQGDLDRGKLTKACLEQHEMLNEMIIRCIKEEMK